MKNSKPIISTPSHDDDDSDALGSGESPELRQVIVPGSLHGSRLDRALASLVPEFSRSYLQQLVEAGAASSAGTVLRKVAARVQAGQPLCVELRPTAQSQSFTPQPMALEMLWEDAHLCVVNKPAGLVVHPAPGNWSGTLLNGLLARYPQAAQVPRAGIVHRLDKDTSGLMVVARTRACMDALVAMIAAREVSREYLALAHRPWQGKSPIEAQEPIGRDARNRLRMAVVDLNKNAGKSASTRISLLQNSEHGCLVYCKLGTGRTHQIRVHMAHHGHPLVADALYGGAQAAGLTRQALHARRLAFVHPLTGQALALAAPVAADMQAAFEAWGLKYN